MQNQINIPHPLSKNAMKKANKQAKRLENKKRKLTALLNVIELNESDKTVKGTELIMKRSSNKLEETAVKVRNMSSNADDENTTSENLSIHERANKSYPDINKEYKELRQKLKMRKKYLTQLPRIVLNDVGNKAIIQNDEKCRIPLFIKDIQHMLIYSLYGTYFTPFNCPPRWCKIEKYANLKRICLLIVEGISLENYVQYKVQNIEDIFAIKVDVINPSLYNGNLIQEIMAVPLSSNQKEKLKEKFGSEREIVEYSDNVFQMKCIFPTKSSSDGVISRTHSTDTLPRTKLLLSLLQLVTEDYPIPIKGELSERFKDYKLTKDEYNEVSDSSAMFSIDCEMCMTETNENELTRISIVNEEFEVIYDTLVKPYNRITNYLTQYSGIAPGMLDDVNTRLEDVQNHIINLLPADAILVGHSLNMDLHALKMMHPYVIDTSLIYNIVGDRHRKSKLKTLTKEFLCVDIQMSKSGHDSAEDSIAAMKLVQLKLKKGLLFGDAVALGKHVPTSCENGENSDIIQTNILATSILSSLPDDGKKVSITTNEEYLKKYKHYVKNGSDKYEMNEVGRKKNVIASMKNSLKDSRLTIGHVWSNGEDLEKLMKRLDKWCTSLWTDCEDCTLFVTLLVPNDDKNATCFISPKTHKSE